MRRILFALSILLIPAAAPAGAELGLDQLADLERQWALKREALNAYHVTQRTQRWRDGEKSPWREDVFIRFGNALHHSFHNESHPGRVNESVTIEQDGEHLAFSRRGVMRTFLGIDARGLGRVFIGDAGRITVLAAPPDDETWEFILHAGHATDHYIVHAETGAVLKREARDTNGRLTYFETRTPTPLDTAHADAAITALMARAESAQAERNTEADRNHAHGQRASWLAWGLVLICLAAASRWLLGGFGGRTRHLWPVLTVTFVALILVSFAVMEVVFAGYYTMLLAAAADIPAGAFNLPRTLIVYNVMTTLIHAGGFAIVYLIPTWLAIRLLRRRSQPKPPPPLPAAA